METLPFVAAVTETDSKFKVEDGILIGESNGLYYVLTKDGNYTATAFPKLGSKSVKLSSQRTREHTQETMLLASSLTVHKTNLSTSEAKTLISGLGFDELSDALVTQEMITEFIVTSSLKDSSDTGDVVKEIPNSASEKECPKDESKEQTQDHGPVVRMVLKAIGGK